MGSEHHVCAHMCAGILESGEGRELCSQTHIQEPLSRKLQFPQGWVPASQALRGLRNLACLGSICAQEGSTSVCIRDVSMYLREVLLCIQKVSICIRDVSMYIRDISMCIRDVSMCIRRVCFHVH